MNANVLRVFSYTGIDIVHQFHYDVRYFLYLLCGYVLSATLFSAPLVSARSSLCRRSEILPCLFFAYFNTL